MATKPTRSNRAATFLRAGAPGSIAPSKCGFATLLGASNVKAAFVKALHAARDRAAELGRG